MEAKIKSVYLRYDDRNRRPFGLVIYDGINFGWSLCHTKDQFSKAKARLIAMNRLSTKRDYLEELTAMVYKEGGLFWTVKREPFNVVGFPYEYRSKINVVTDVMLRLAVGSGGAKKAIAASHAAFDKAVESLK